MHLLPLILINLFKERKFEFRIRENNFFEKAQKKERKREKWTKLICKHQ